MPRRLQGVLPIVHTPFTDDDEIDVATLQREIDWAFAQGADGLGTGMVSEMLRLTYDERIALTHHSSRSSAGRGPVFAGVGAESTKQALIYAAGRGEGGLRRGDGGAAADDAAARAISSSITSAPSPTASRCR